MSNLHATKTRLLGILFLMSSAAQANTPASNSAPTAPLPANEIVVEVAGTPITRGEIDRIADMMAGQRQRLEIDVMGPHSLAKNPVVHEPSQSKRQQSADAATERASALRKQTQETARDKLVEMELLYEAARTEPPADLTERLAKKMADKKARFVSPKHYENALKGYGMTEADLEKFTRKEVLIDHFIAQHFLDKAEVTDELVRKFYDDNREKFKSMEESRHLAQILIVPGKGQVTEKLNRAAEAKAKAIHARLRNGGDFEDLARKESQCPSARHGGDLDFVAKGQMSAVFEKVAFATDKGSISEVFRSPQGFHIVKVIDIKPAEYVAFDKAKDGIKQHLKSMASHDAVDRFLTDAKNRTKITVVAPGRFAASTD